MHSYLVRFEHGNQAYEDIVEAVSTEAARRLFQAKYPAARILNIKRVV